MFCCDDMALEKYTGMTMLERDQCLCISTSRSATITTNRDTKL